MKAENKVIVVTGGGSGMGRELTATASMRPGGMNYKGVFTRDRKPKMAAYYLRSKWNKDLKTNP